MSKHALLSVAGLAVVAASSVASANQLKLYTGQGGAIPDGPTGLLRREINVTDHGPVKDVGITLSALTHTWVGDVTITLTHKPTGASSVLVSRPGFTGTGFGDSSNFGADYNFNDSFTGSIPNAAAALPDAGVVPGGNYAPVTAMASLRVPDKFGVWSLEIRDAAAADVGNLGAWTLALFNVPTPGAAALFGIAGLAAARRRR